MYSKFWLQEKKSEYINWKRKKRILTDTQSSTNLTDSYLKYIKRLTIITNFRIEYNTALIEKENFVLATCFGDSVFRKWNMKANFHRIFKTFFFSDEIFLIINQFKMDRSRVSLFIVFLSNFKVLNVLKQYKITIKHCEE
jgi:hypothetical protein